MYFHNFFESSFLISYHSKIRNFKNEQKCSKKVEIKIYISTKLNYWINILNGDSYRFIHSIVDFFIQIACIRYKVRAFCNKENMFSDIDIDSTTKILCLRKFNNWKILIFKKFVKYGIDNITIFSFKTKKKN